ncbi:hypothetical protein B0H17DRAFT_416651 [Mycena rosella]|uniref:Uncharacterized protein n=1 Tax=Mycena rosella TaxID=1033263 RepID=A0AAD7GL53_MYCRO|nr:hypothetical protein B0H17DRAFT_416651 [Mycena rosella]
MSFPNPGLQSAVPDVTRNDILSSSSSEFDWILETDATAPPSYTQYDDEYPPPYQQPSHIRRTAAAHQIPLQDRFRFEEARRQQELQFLLGVLLSIGATLFLMDALPMLGEPTTSIHAAIRTYGCFAIVLVLSILLTAVSLLSKYWLTGNHHRLLQFGPQIRGVPESRLQVAKTYAMNGLIALGSFMTYAMVVCFAVGVIDFFWQLYPAVSMGIVTTCGIYRLGSGPLLSFGQGALFKMPMASALRHAWGWPRIWAARGSGGSTNGELERGGEEAMVRS